MMLGKRQSPPVKRTASMTEFTLDLDLDLNLSGAGEQPDSADPHNPFHAGVYRPVVGIDNRFLTVMVSPRNHRRNSADFMETPHFLKACHLCKSRLIPGRDIFMYRGDSAFCSLECREEQIIQDERKEKCCFGTKKKGSTSVATGSEVPPVGETVAV